MSLANSYSEFSNLRTPCLIEDKKKTRVQIGGPCTWGVSSGFIFGLNLWNLLRLLLLVRMLLPIMKSQMGDLAFKEEC